MKIFPYNCIFTFRTLKAFLITTEYFYVSPKLEALICRNTFFESISIAFLRDKQSPTAYKMWLNARKDCGPEKEKD